MNLFKSRVAAVAVGASVIVAFGASTAGAAHLITGHQMKAGTVTSREIKNGGIRYVDLAPGTKAIVKNGADGKPGARGKDGKDGLSGAVYRVENYKNGGGGSATVACADDEAESQKYVAIAGGVQGNADTTDQSPDGFAVSSSFPGRMNWDTGAPKQNRLDGWIVLGNAKHTATLKVWALCVPSKGIPVQTVDLDN